MFHIIRGIAESQAIPVTFELGHMAIVSLEPPMEHCDVAIS